MVAVFLLTAAGLMFELTLTRLFSATIWYHYTFVAVSVALFGWGLGGFLVYLYASARPIKDVATVIVVLCLLLGALLVAFPFGILQFPFTPERLTLYFGLSLAPFLVGGAVLSLIFQRHGADSNRLYFADLFGAAAGTLLAPLAISLLGAESAILAASIPTALAAILMTTALASGRRATLRALAVVGLIASLTLVAVNVRSPFLTIRDAPQKALYRLLDEHPRAEVVFDRWNAYSRITSVQGFDDYHVARLFIDSDAETSVLRWDRRNDSLPDGAGWFRALPLRMKADPKVLVIGPGGGTDVVLALTAAGAKVTAVEMNPLIIDAVRELGDEAGNVYQHPDVKLVMDEGRNFVERTAERFDFIILGFVDSWASVASGGLSLTENYLYTQDALEAYYKCLTPEGALMIIRWPTDIPRLVANSVSFLTERNIRIPEIGHHILAVAQREPDDGDPVQSIFLLARSRIAPEMVDRILEGHPQCHVFHAPGRPSASPYAELFDGRLSFAEYTQSFDRLATPVDDNQPFYFADQKPYGLPHFVMRLFSLPVIAVVVFTILLLIGVRVSGVAAPGPRTTTYFSALGLGFIICEIALMQRLILLLGHPIYSIVVILFTLLLAGGLGSAYAKRFKASGIGDRLMIILPSIVGLVLLTAWGLPALVQAAMPLTLNLRIAIAAAVAFPFGFLMGMPFPLGLRAAATRENGPPVSALWGLNGVASVVGSIATVVIAVVGGFTVTFIVGAACYATAWLTRPLRVDA